MRVENRQNSIIYQMFKFGALGASAPTPFPDQGHFWHELRKTAKPIEMPFGDILVWARGNIDGIQIPTGRALLQWTFDCKIKD